MAIYCYQCKANTDDQHKVYYTDADGYPYELAECAWCHQVKSSIRTQSVYQYVIEKLREWWYVYARRN